MEHEIIGHKKIVAYLKESIERNDFFHTYIFIGPAHIGKAMLAQWMIDQIHPCEQIVLPGADDATYSAVTIEDVRGALSLLSRSTHEGGYRTVFIPHAELMTVQASNALLKMLEEPPVRTIFILCTPHEYQVLPTIRSRCAAVRFALVPQHEMLDAVRTRGCSNPAWIADVSGGRPGIAFRMLNDSSYADTFEHTMSFLLSTDDQPLWQRLATLQTSEAPMALDALECALHAKIHTQSEDSWPFMLGLFQRLTHLRSVPILQSSKSFPDQLFIA